MENNVNEPGPLHRLIPMTPPSRNMPNIPGAKTVTGDIRRAGVTKPGNKNWIGYTARAGCVARVTGKVRATNKARAGNTPRVTDAVRAGHAVTTRYGNQECGCPSEDGAPARGVQRKIGHTDHRVPAHTAMNRPEVVGVPHIQHPLEKSCRSSSS